MASNIATVQPLALVQQAMDKGIAPEQLGKLLDLQERWERNEAAKDYAEAITQFQAECPRIYKHRQASFDGKPVYKFASFDDIDAQVRPLLTKYGIVVTFSTSETTAQGITVTVRIRVGTHVEESNLRVPVPSQMKVNDTQRFGAALAYAKRYALCDALNIVVTDEDDDAANLAARVGVRELEIVKTLLSKCEKWTAAKILHVYKLERLEDMTAADYEVIKRDLAAEVHARNKPQPQVKR